MAKQHTPESDEARLKKKIAGTPGDSSNPAALRSLRKRLKREQRRRRALALRRKLASG